jgi:hypothetical protein
MTFSHVKNLPTATIAKNRIFAYLLLMFVQDVHVITTTKPTLTTSTMIIIHDLNVAATTHYRHHKPRGTFKAAYTEQCKSQNA